jgi:hypothetical protein
MSTHTHKISLGHVDVSRLETEDDFRREAQRLLPNALVQVGEAAGEVAWDECHWALQNQPPRGASKPANWLHAWNVIDPWGIDK